MKFEPSWPLNRLLRALPLDKLRKLLPELEQILQGTLNTIDGRVLQWMCRWQHPYCDLEKLSGSDFIYRLAEHCALRGERLFLLGAGEDANSRAVVRFRQLWPEYETPDELARLVLDQLAGRVSKREAASLPLKVQVAI